jgi:hypothetical protein
MESRQGDNYHKLSLSAAAVPCIHTYRRKHRASHKTLFSPFFSFFLHVFCLVIHLFLFSLGFFLFAPWWPPPCLFSERRELPTRFELI